MFMTSQGSPAATQCVVFIESSSLILHGTFVISLFYCDDSLTC